MKKVSVAGLQIDNTTKHELLNTLTERLKAEERTFVITPYSEFLYHSLTTPQLLEVFNQANFSLPDGIGIFWAAKFLQIPFTVKNYYLKIFQAFWQVAYSLLAILLRPTYIYSALPGGHKISGSDLVWDLAQLAAEHRWSIYVLGGYGDTPELVAQKLKVKYEKLKIAGWSNKGPDDPAVIEDIQRTKPDMVFVAYGPVKQEQWIAKNMDTLPAKFYIGLGGTFDYIAGVRKSPPGFIRRIGLEWLYRLLTQPHRYKRIWQATFGLVLALIKQKIYLSLPYRQNVVSVVLNKDNNIFIARFNPEKEVIRALGKLPNQYENYWQFPQGGLEKGESIIDGAKRELCEETAMTTVEVLKVMSTVYRYTWDNISRRPLFSRPRYHYRGQEQSLVYFRFLGEDKEINLDFDEFLEYKWVPQDKLLQEIHPQKKPLADIIIQQGLKSIL